MSLVDSLQPGTRLLDKQRDCEQLMRGVERDDTEASAAETDGGDTPEAPR